VNPVLGVGLALGLALVGRRLRWLTASGAIAAATVGAAVFVGGGWAGASWLAVFFVSGSLFGDRPLEPGPVDLGRSWRQVTAKGGWAAVGALIALVGPGCGWALLAGSLAAATADTWATELGTRWGQPAVLITSGRRVAPGRSGAVSTVGTLGGIGGATALAVTVWLTRTDPALGIAALVGGVTGMLFDSVLGATVQGTYRCEACARETEAPDHHRGHALTHVRGWRWIDNDVVNLLATGCGAAAAVGIQLLFAG
jgi:uncharacterized protein (TIGR00297 family)